MRNGILLTVLLLGTAAQCARGQGYGGYPYPGYYYQPAYYPAQAYPAPAYQDVNPYPTRTSNYCPTCQSGQSMPDNPALPAPVVPPLPVYPQEPCDPQVMGRLGPACGSCGSGSCGLGGCPPSWTDCLKSPNQVPGGYCVYGKLEVLYWWLKNQSVGGLTDTGATGNTVSVPGYSLDLTTVVPDYSLLRDADHLGLRGTIGFWLDAENTWAIEGIVFAVAEAPSPNYAVGGPTRAASATQISSLATILGISNAQATTLVNGLATSTTKNEVVGTAGVFGGAELNLRHEICRSEYGHIDWLLGFRFLDLYEYGGALDGFGGVLVETQNQFYGGQVGLDAEISRGRWYLDGVGKLALGVNRESVSVGTTATGPTSYSAFQGNVGVFRRDEFTTVGDVGVTAGVRIGCNARLFANYTIIYMTDVVRPLPQVAPYLGGATPAFNYNSSSFWAQGVSLGFELRF